MTKYYDHDAWHECKIKKIKSNAFRYKMSQSFFMMDALSYENAPKKPCRLLDLGCGIGDISISFAELGFDVTGIEYSEVAIKKTLKLSQAIQNKPRFIHGDILKADSLISHNEWEFVTAFNVLHCFVDNTDRKQFFNVLKKLVKPNSGHFYLSTMCGLPGKEISKLTKINENTRIGSNGARIHLEPNIILSELSDNGLTVLEYKVLSYNNLTEPGFETQDLTILGCVKG